MSMFDPVKKPSHYNSHPSGIELKFITVHLDFAIGNALKYIWRSGLKMDDIDVKSSKEATIKDLRKAKEYLEMAIAEHHQNEAFWCRKPLVVKDLLGEVVRTEPVAFKMKLINSFISIFDNPEEIKTLYNNLIEAIKDESTNLSNN